MTCSHKSEAAKSRCFAREGAKRWRPFADLRCRAGTPAPLRDHAILWRPSASPAEIVTAARREGLSLSNLLRAFKCLWGSGHDCACPSGSTPRPPPGNAWPARGAGGPPTLAPIGCVARAGTVLGVSEEPPRQGRQGRIGPPTPRAFLPDYSGPKQRPFGQPTGPSLHFRLAIREWECACARASRSGRSSYKARSAAGPGVRGAPGRPAAGRGGAQEAEAGADQRGRAEPAGLTVTGPLTSSPFPSPPAGLPSRLLSCAAALRAAPFRLRRAGRPREPRE